MYSDEVNNLLLSVVPCFSGTFMMTNRTHKGKKIRKANLPTGNEKEFTDKYKQIYLYNHFSVKVIL